VIARPIARASTIAGVTTSMTIGRWPGDAAASHADPHMLDHDSIASHSLERRTATWRDGWTLTFVAAAAIASLAGATILAGAASPEAIGRAIRLTARTSFALFTGAFTASAAHRLWPGRFTRWQRRNRRYLGVAFAASHAVHAAAIATLAALHPAAFHDHAADMARAPGLVGYGLLAAMTATSFDRTAAWLGRRAWKVLHLVGAIYLWGAFLLAFAKRAPHAPGYWLPVALAVAALVVRVVAWYRGRHVRGR
jgi:sulfoxide reductase heme-binding subunit YedZ